VVAIGAAVVVVAVLVVLFASGQSARPTYPRTAIAVLPCRNLTTEGPWAFVADALHGEILTQLARVTALKPMGRTSVLSYAVTTKPPAVIADELGVGTIVECEVQVARERLRVNVGLIEVTSGEVLWGNQYPGTMDDAFAIQSAIAQDVVRAVDASLTEAEATALATAPTENDEAYLFFLQGEQYRLRPGEPWENLKIAQQLYERARAADPRFALARARLAQVHAWMFQLRYDPSAMHLRRLREEADAALRLAPDLPEAHIAKGWEHYATDNYRRALEEFEAAAATSPNDAEVVRWIGSASRRLGNWEAVLAAFDRAAQLDPRNVDLFEDLGGITYRVLHRYADAVGAFDFALSLDPLLAMAAVDKGWAYIEWRGELDTLRAALARLPPELELGRHLGSTTLQRASLLLWERHADSLLTLLATTSKRIMGPYTEISPTSLYQGWAHQLRGDRAAARVAFDSARIVLDSVLTEHPDDWRVHGARGLTLAGLGRRDEALKEADWLEQSETYREDAFFGSLAAVNRAWILAQAGAVEPALVEIERLLTSPSFFVSAHTLRLDPRWDPIRDDPRFQALLVRYAEPQPVRY
jgi:serine/threonine-protein kinase